MPLGKTRCHVHIVNLYTGNFATDSKTPAKLKQHDRVTVHTNPDKREHSEFIEACARAGMVCRWIQRTGNFHLYMLWKAR